MGRGSLWGYTGRLIGKPAGLGTASPVAAAAAQNTAEQALARVAVTHSAMDKSFDFHAGLLFQRDQFPQRELPCRDDSGDLLIPDQPNPFRAGQRHLCACVKGKAGEISPQETQNPQILHNHTVQPFLIKGKHVGIQLVQFSFLDKSIDRQINFSAEKMGKMNPFTNFLCCKIIRIGPGAVALPA